MVVQELSPGAIAAALKKADTARCVARRTAVEHYQGMGLEAEVRPYFALGALAQVSIDCQRVARRFIDKRYSVYQAAPTRTAKDEDYMARQGDLDRAMVPLERLSGVLGTTALLVTAGDGEALHHVPLVEFEPLWAADDPEPYGMAYPLFTTDSGKRPEEREWVVWTDALHFQVRGGNAFAVVGPDGMVNDKMVNPYGVAPVVWVHREPDLTGGWWRPMAEDLLTAQRSYNVLMTQGNLGAMFQALGQEVLIGVMDAKDFRRDVQRAVLLPQGAEYRIEAPPGGIAQIQEWMRWKLDSVAATMGLKIKWADGTGGATSGEHQRILEVELTTSIMSDFPLWAEVEKERHAVARAVYQFHFGHDLGEDLSVNFTEPNIPQSAQEMRDEFDYELGKGLASLHDYWRRKDPSITTEQIEERMKQVQAERAAFAPAGPAAAGGARAGGGLAAMLMNNAAV